MNSKKSATLLIIVTMHPPDYIQSVLDDYHAKKAANRIPFDMLQLSPARFKAACLEVCRKGYNPKDQRVLEAFFEEDVDKDTCYRVIERCEIDKFRPLINFLKGSTTTTEGKNIELLAWLIDFKNRPWQMGTTYDRTFPPDEPGVEPVKAKDGTEIENPGPGRGEEKDRLSGRTTDHRVSNTKKIIATVIVLTGLGIGAYFLRANGPVILVPTGPQNCMFWTGDHYQQVSCNVHFKDTTIIALDSELLNNFKKITKPDTITTHAVGYVWYVRYRGQYEYYTHDGYHPIDPQLRLRPITEFIINRHIPANP